MNTVRQSIKYLHQYNLEMDVKETIRWHLKLSKYYSRLRKIIYEPLFLVSYFAYQMSSNPLFVKSIIQMTYYNLFLNYIYEALIIGFVLYQMIEIIQWIQLVFLRKIIASYEIFFFFFLKSYLSNDTVESRLTDINWGRRSVGKFKIQDKGNV